MNNPIISTLRLCSIFLCLCVSCNRGNNSGDTKTIIAGKDEYYTCSMDPQVIEYKPGNCPICRMKLIKVQKNQLKPGQIKLSAQQSTLANISYDTLRERELSKEVVLTGKVTIDQSRTESISAKVQGRITTLAIKNAGDYISKGQLLYEIYSESLNTAQQEYILALQKELTNSPHKTEQFRKAAKNKLMLFGMSEEQLTQIEKSQQILQVVPVYSAADGFVHEVSVTEGSYVSTGTTLFLWASHDALWIETQVYLPYLGLVKKETQAVVSIPAAGNKHLQAKVVFIEPQIRTPQRFVVARFQMNAPEQEVKPGMLASIIMQTQRKKTLLLPLNALILDSKGSTIWVRNKDGIFENRMITTGMQNSTQVEVLDGLEIGEVVVVQGAYLLNSEYILKKGANPMEGHKGMHDMKM